MAILPHPTVTSPSARIRLPRLPPDTPTSSLPPTTTTPTPLSTISHQTRQRRETKRLSRRNDRSFQYDYFAVEDLNNATKTGSARRKQRMVNENALNNPIINTTIEEQDILPSYPTSTSIFSRVISIGLSTRELRVLEKYHILQQQQHQHHQQSSHNLILNKTSLKLLRKRVKKSNGLKEWVKEIEDRVIVFLNSAKEEVLTIRLRDSFLRHLVHSLCRWHKTVSASEETGMIPEEKTMYIFHPRVVHLGRANADAESEHLARDDAEGIVNDSNRIHSSFSNYIFG